MLSAYGAMDIGIGLVFAAALCNQKENNVYCFSF